ncbi:MAG: alkaline phosphatase family protein [bacterium]
MQYWTAIVLPLLLSPLVLVFALQSHTPPSKPVQADRATVPAAPDAPQRVVVVIVDSLQPTLVTPERMPFLASLKHHRYALETCQANFTLPCIKTAMEGRQSPVSSRLHNFTGVSGALDAIPVAAATIGWPVHLYSDHTLDSLYGDHVTESVNVEKSEGDPLEHDLSAFAATNKVLATGEPSLVVLHTAGTDKAAHFKGVGSEAYFEHFRVVDGAIKEMTSHLDLNRDALLIFGDHGHDGHGGHTIGSTAIFEGNWAGLPATDSLNQMDLYLFLAEALGLTIPRSYEGHYFYLEHPINDARLSRFAKRQQQAFVDAGYPAELDVALAQVHAEKASKSLDTLNRAVPAVLFWIWFYLAVGGAMMQRRRLDRRHGVVLASSFAAIWLGAAGLGAVALVVAPWLIWGWRRPEVHARLEASGLALILAAAGLSALGMDYFRFFWGADADASMNLLLVFGGMALMGLALSWAVTRKPDAMPEMTAAFSALVLPSGAYFMNSGPNYLRALLVGGIMLMVWRKGLAHIESRRPMRRPAWSSIGLGALFMVTIGWMQWDRSANWIWQFLPRYYMEQVAPWLAWLVLAVAAGLASPRRWPLGALALALVYSVGFGEMGVAVLAATALCMVVVGVWERMRFRTGVRPAGKWLAVAQPVFVAIIALQAAWIMFDSFDINHIEFGFGYKVFGALQTEAQRFALYFVLGFVKYGLPIAAVVWTFVGERRREQPSVLLGASAFLAIKIGFLFAQITAGVALTDQHVFEVAVSEVAFVWIVSVLLALMALRPARLDI